MLRSKRCLNVSQLLYRNDGGGESEIRIADHSASRIEKSIVRHTSERESAETLALLRNTVAREVLRVFLGQNPKKGYRSYVEGGCYVDC